MLLMLYKYNWSLRIEENSLVTKTRECQIFEADVGSKLRQISRSNSCQAATICFDDSWWRLRLNPATSNTSQLFWAVSSGINDPELRVSDCVVWDKNLTFIRFESVKV